MNLEQFVAVMRPRGSFEAVDLGFLMVRRFWKRLIVAWLLISLPVIALLALWLPAVPMLGLPIFWWLKPLFERPLLFVLSRALFGAVPRWREVFSWRALGPGLFGDLTWRRLSPHRSLTMPVTLLEGSRGAVGRQRRLLIGSADFAGGGLTYGCWMAEIALFFASFFFLDMLLPSGYTGFNGIDFENTDVWPVSLGLAFYSLYYLAASLLEPFYVGGGFLLYLQRRTALEGWDVELAFRRMVARRWRIDIDAARRAGAAVLLVFGLALPGPPPAAAQAEIGAAARAASAAEAAEAEPAAEPSEDDEDAGGEAGEGEESLAPIPPEDAHVAIQEIVAQPEFGGSRMEETWRFKNGEKLFETRDPDFEMPTVPLPWGLLRWLLLVVLLALVGYFLYRAWRDRVSFAGAGVKTVKGPAGQRRFGLEEDPLAPIEGVAARARQALEAGQPDKALAWLYRGAFQELAGRGLLPLRRDFTEDDCLRHLRRKAAGRSAAAAAAALPHEQLFREIAGAWMRLAYGHFEIPKADIARLCTAFERVFAPPAEVAA